MELARSTPTPGWRATWLAEAQTHSWTRAGLALAIAVTAWLLVASLARVAAGEAEAGLRLGLLGGLASLLVSALEGAVGGAACPRSARASWAWACPGNRRSSMSAS
jgi:hypothetical protein